MKKKLALLLACLMAVAMFAGCGKEQKPAAVSSGSFGADTQAIIDRGVLWH